MTRRRPRAGTGAPRGTVGVNCRESSSGGVVDVWAIGRPSTEERSGLSQPTLERIDTGRRYRDCLVAILFFLAADELLVCEEVDGIAQIVAISSERCCQWFEELARFGWRRVGQA